MPVRFSSDGRRIEYYKKTSLYKTHVEAYPHLSTTSHEDVSDGITFLQRLGLKGFSKIDSIEGAIAALKNYHPLFVEVVE